MKGITDDHRSDAAEAPAREWVTPELEVIPMKEALASPIGINAPDSPFGYS
jgi:hypothetical protein